MEDLPKWVQQTVLVCSVLVAVAGGIAGVRALVASVVRPAWRAGRAVVNAAEAIRDAAEGYPEVNAAVTALRELPATVTDLTATVHELQESSQHLADKVQELTYLHHDVDGVARMVADLDDVVSNFECYRRLKELRDRSARETPREAPDQVE